MIEPSVQAVLCKLSLIQWGGRNCAVAMAPEAFDIGTEKIIFEAPIISGRNTSSWQNQPIKSVTTPACRIKRLHKTLQAARNEIIFYDHGIQ